MDSQKKFDIFISYRHKDSIYAQSIYNFLVGKKYRVFLDTTGLGAGYFDEQLYQILDQVSDLVLIMTTDTLDNCIKPDDWLHIEVAYAIKNGKNVVPFFVNYSIQDGDKLPSDMKDLRYLHGVPYSKEYFLDGLARLEQHLRCSQWGGITTPLPPEDNEPLEPTLEIIPVQPTGRKLGKPYYTKKDMQRARRKIRMCLQEQYDKIENMLQEKWITNKNAYRRAKTVFILVQKQMGAYDWLYDLDMERVKFENVYGSGVVRLLQCCRDDSPWLSDEMRNYMRQFNGGLKELIRRLDEGR